MLIYNILYSSSFSRQSTFMDILSIINKKKQKRELTEQEIDFFVYEYTINKTIKDYQASSLLTAMNINGLSNNETYYLTKSFINYSSKFEFDKNNEVLIDKHSSGGIGDKVSIIIIPILLALGYKIAKISGRGLGFTGGTIDKLDSIKTKTNFSFNKANKIFKKIGSILMQQTDDLVPSDKLIYALRDVTANVDSPGLIVSSILSKKFVVNSDYIFIDLKVGSGALANDLKKANELAKRMINVANLMNRKICITLTNMNEPLGHFVGNFLEIKESINFLLNINVSNDLKEIIYEFVIKILLLTKKAKNQSEAIKKIDSVINNKIAYELFLKWLKEQKASLKQLKKYQQIKSKYILNVNSNKTGYLEFISASEIGLISLELGAGRKTKNSKIDFWAGIEILKKNNNLVKKGGTIAKLYSSKPIDEKLIMRYLNNLKFNKKAKNYKSIIINSLTNM